VVVLVVVVVVMVVVVVVVIVVVVVVVVVDDDIVPFACKACVTDLCAVFIIALNDCVNKLNISTRPYSSV
jgi:hypothetical protein